MAPRESSFEGFSTCQHENFPFMHSNFTLMSSNKHIYKEEKARPTFRSPIISQIYIFLTSRS